MVKEDGAPFVIPPTLIQDTVVWGKELDYLFRTLRDPKDEEDGVKINSDPSCLLHTHVSLKKEVPKKRLGVRPSAGSEKNFPISLRWDHHLSYVLPQAQNKMHRVLRQGFF